MGHDVPCLSRGREICAGELRGAKGATLVAEGDDAGGQAGRPTAIGRPGVTRIYSPKNNAPSYSNLLKAPRNHAQRYRRRSTNQPRHSRRLGQLRRDGPAHHRWKQTCPSADRLPLWRYVDRGAGSSTRVSRGGGARIGRVGCRTRRIHEGSRHQNSIGKRALAAYSPSQSSPCNALMITTSQLTCPECGYSSAETMPMDACIYFHQCAGCGTTLRPKPGDCCVFCSYGSVPCPPIQVQRG